MLKQVPHKWKTYFFSHIEIATEKLNTSAAGSGHNEHCVYIAEREDITFQ